ncbi:uncharacterized protein BDZ99DRAFT_394432, partial [Mytilinidion resinicola]
ICDYTQVHYRCFHLRYTVRAWCTKYQEAHKRCPANVVAPPIPSLGRVHYAVVHFPWPIIEDCVFSRPLLSRLYLGHGT